MNWQELKDKIVAELKVSKEKAEQLLSNYKKEAEKELVKIRQKLEEQDLPKVEELLAKLKEKTKELKIEEIEEKIANFGDKLKRKTLTKEEIDQKLLELEKKLTSIFNKNNPNT